jgi:hypothetical protein
VTDEHLDAQRLRRLLDVGRSLATYAHPPFRLTP